MHTSRMMGLRTKDIEGIARIQIWQPKHKSGSCSSFGEPLQNLRSREDAPGPVPSPPISELRRSSPNATSISGTVRQFPTSASVQPSTVLVLFTTWEHRKAILHLRGMYVHPSNILPINANRHKTHTVESEIRIITERCDCRSEDPTLRASCKRVVLEYKPPSRASFKIRLQTEKIDRQGEVLPSTCNLALFGLCYPDYEVQPRLSAVDVVENVQWLCLSFSSVDKRVAFTKTFAQACKIRDEDRRAFEERALAVRNRANRPNDKSCMSSGPQSNPQFSESGSTTSVITSSSDAEISGKF